MDPVAEPAQFAGRPGGGGGDRARRDRGPEQFTERDRDACLGQELPDVKVDDHRGDPGSVLHRRGDSLGCLPGGVGPAGTAPLDHLMFGHPQADRREIEHLAVFAAHLRRLREIIPAPAAATRFVDLYIVGDLDPGQGRARVPVLPTGLTCPALAQRLRCRFGQPVRARRLRGVLRGRRQAGLQRGDPHQRLTQIGRQRIDQRVPRRELREQLLDRRHPRHRAIIDTTTTTIKPPRRSHPYHWPQRPRQDLTSYLRTTSSRNSLGWGLGTIDILPAETLVSTDQMSPTRAADPLFVRPPGSSRGKASPHFRLVGSSGL